MPKRGNGEGTYYKLPSGNWCYRDYVQTRAGKQRMAFTAPSKPLAKQAWKDYVQEHGETPIERVETVEDWANKWLEIYKKPNVEWKVHEDYKMYICRHVLPQIGAIALMDVRPAHIARLYATAKNRKSEPLKRTSLEKIRIALNGIFETAIDNSLCVQNPAKKVDLPERSPSAPKVFTQDQMGKVIEYLPRHQYGPYIAFLLYTGLRIGELLALVWSDIDTTEKLIHIRRSITRTEDGEVVGEHTKTKKERVVPYDKGLEPYLDAISHKGLYVVCHSDGSTLTHHQFDTLYYSFFKDLNNTIEESMYKLPRLTPHKCRHTFATYMLRSGVDIRVVQLIMGHSTIKTTEIYTQVDVDDMKKILQNSLLAPNSHHACL